MIKPGFNSGLWTGLDSGLDWTGFWTGLDSGLDWNVVLVCVFVPAIVSLSVCSACPHSYFWGACKLSSCWPNAMATGEEPEVILISSGDSSLDSSASDVDDLDRSDIRILLQGHRDDGDQLTCMAPTGRALVTSGDSLL